LRLKKIAGVFTPNYGIYSRIMNDTQRLLSIVLAPFGFIAFIAALVVILASIAVNDTAS
jgi:hypothetical protein